MVVIELRFLAHRFHATAWGRHVNEGVAEWPPSPYRLLRGLYDAWKRKHSEIPETQVESVLSALATEPPHFGLPVATASHTRSYLSAPSEDPTEKSLIFDAFVATDRDAVCYMAWRGVELDPAERGVLGALLASLNYLGRSESWIEARVTDEVPGGQKTCVPAEPGETGEVNEVACVVPPLDYQGKRRWIDALAYYTSELLKERRSSPPLLRMVPYTGVGNSITTHVRRQEVRKRPIVGAVLIGLDSPVLPLVTSTLEIAEQVRTRLMGIHKQARGDDHVSPRFSGKSLDGEPLSGHQHAFILPLENETWRIDRVLIYTRRDKGFEPDEVQAILRLNELWQADNRPKVRCVATWKGAAEDSAIRPPAKVVVSTTPFVTARHTRRGRGTPEEFAQAEVLRECRHHGLPTPRVELWKRPGLFDWIEFRRNRKDDPPRPGFGFRLTFEEGQAAPFSLGYGCHFGLGQFGPERGAATVATA